MKNPQSSLPPGFRFHPTDEELILQYLKKKIASIPFPVSIIADVDIYKFDPWDLPAKAAFGEKEWYFFSPRDRKYPNGARPNRAAASGYWKATGTDKVIVASSTMPAGGGGGVGVQENIGVKKALVFYKGRPPKGIKTNWIMHEYRLADALAYNIKPVKPKDSSSTAMRLDDWVLCRIYKKTHASPPSSSSSAAAAAASDRDQEEEEEEEGEEQFVQEAHLPSLKNPLSNKTLMPQKSSSFSNLLDAMDYSILRSFLSDNQFNNPTGFDSTPSSVVNGAITEQPLFNNCNPHTNSGSSSYLIQKLPQLSTPIPNMENKLKRPFPSIDEDMNHYPSKKLINSCSFTNSNSQTDMAYHQYNVLNQPLLNQQLLLSPHLQFQS
ncbi:hypothetical protein GH714_021972 [Hevea brasiliensis]|uniref:NAC domain-containing protein n=1 Tax=Hevea brasiliensis TaxID=3981 RepID=A0A6A6M2K7_HEVBR|nr:hypothetical protein GH714_021972 [Hevea brasiliensis]